MKPNELLYCIHDGEFMGEDEDTIVITFCPVLYWNERKCLPDYPFCCDDGVENCFDQYLPQGFSIILCREETMWSTPKTKCEARKELNQIGFIESLELEQFLTSCGPF